MRRVLNAASHAHYVERMPVEDVGASTFPSAPPPTADPNGRSIASALSMRFFLICVFGGIIAGVVVVDVLLPLLGFEVPSRASFAIRLLVVLPPVMFLGWCYVSHALSQALTPLETGAHLTTAPTTRRPRYATRRRHQALTEAGYAHHSNQAVMLGDRPMLHPIAIYGASDELSTAVVDANGHVTIQSVLEDERWLKTAAGRQYQHPNVTVQFLRRAKLHELKNAHFQGLIAMGAAPARMKPYDSFSATVDQITETIRENFREGRPFRKAPIAKGGRITTAT